MNWLLLVLAGLLEVCWAVGLKSSHGFTRFYPSLFTLCTMIASFALLALAMRTLPLGTAYAVWTGIGAVGTAVVGMLIFNDPASVGRIVCLLFIVSGIVGLKMLAE